MAETTTNRASIALQVVAFTFLILIVLDGRHPPARAQSVRPAPSTAVVIVDHTEEIRADQRRDDNIADLRDQVAANKLTLQKQWDAINTLKDAVAKNNALLEQQALDAKAGHGSNTGLDVGMMASILASIGLQLRNTRRNRRRRSSSPEDED